MINVGRLSEASAAPATGERFVELLSLRGVVVEEILSSDTPDQTPYQQAQDEWVVVLEGRAVLEVEGAEVVLEAGSHLVLPAGTRHRVVTTRAGTRWLAVHIHPSNGPPTSG